MGGNWGDLPSGVEIIGEYQDEYAGILNYEALEFVKKLELEIRERRSEILRRRVERQKEIDSGKLLDFLPETQSVREGDWVIAPLPQDLLDRRVEITGPAGDRKMVINALNSGARCFMADLEDSNSPTWQNTIGGQINLRDAVNRTIQYINPLGKRYTLSDQVATLLVRPRGWHLDEKHILVDGQPTSGSILDFALYFYHNARNLLARGSGPYYYLPKLESYLEARLWNDVFNLAQDELEIPRGSIKATVLIETLPAAFEADEILYELRDHSSGLNCGRWDYIFSYIKKLRNHPEYLLPDRSLVTMTVPFMRAYSTYVIQTCHKRKVHAMGGMAAQIPVKNDPLAHEEAMQKVRLDKEREAMDGHDGTWVAHPGLVSIALEVFDQWMPMANQIDQKKDDIQITAEDLLTAPAGSITEQGLRTNINVAIQYIEAWLRGVGAVPIFNLMEDAATAEISRTQIWQWIQNANGILNDGRKVSLSLVEQLIDEEIAKIRDLVGKTNYENGRFDEATNLFWRLINDEELIEFLTLPGYQHL